MHVQSHLHSHHAGDGHHHGVGLGEAATGILAASILATLLLVVVEFAAGYAGKSIALVSDAIHNLTDAPTLVISWLAMRWALRPATSEKTYGYHRAGILAAFVNAIVLTLAAVVLIGESVIRLRHPVEVQTGWMLWVSILALAINGGITLAVSRGRGDLNVRTVWIHNLGDALSNVAILIGALVIRYGRPGGFQWLDALIGMGIGGMVLLSGAGILRESGHILLEGLPRDINLQEVARAILAIDGVEEVHDIHIWTLGPGLNALSSHVRIPDMHLEHCERLLGKVRAVLAEDFNITHTTIQFERAGLPASGLLMPEPVRRASN
jgi:cobalt-zinc-cadmium efflux system protein